MAASRRNARPPLEPFSPRNLWLATLGAVALARRQAGNAAASAIAAAGLAGERLAGVALDARGAARDRVAGLRGGVEPVIGGFGAGVEARLAPVLDRLGLAPPRQPRKPAPSSRRGGWSTAAGKAGSTPARKAAPARKRTARAGG